MDLLLGGEREGQRKKEREREVTSEESKRTL